jgi:hypothetical protein
VKAQHDNSWVVGSNRAAGLFLRSQKYKTTVWAEALNAEWKFSGFFFALVKLAIKKDHQKSVPGLSFGRALRTFDISQGHSKKPFAPTQEFA